MIRSLLTTPEGDVREGDERLIDDWQTIPGSDPLVAVGPRR